VAHLGRAQDRSPIEAGPGIAALLEADSLGVPAPHTVTFGALRHLQRIDEDGITLARPLGVQVPAPNCADVPCGPYPAS
jgi:hypothetical protein